MIVLPMAGESSRFLKQGYTLPKYQLPLWGETVFDWVLQSFHRYFETEHFLFIVQNRFEVDGFTERRLRALRVRSFELVALNESTRGQAETVYLGTRQADAQAPILIFNIDTFRLDYRHPEHPDHTAGFLEVFHGSGNNWSYVGPADAPGLVARTTEKNPISDLCSNGMYQFAKLGMFREVCAAALREDARAANEFYIAPLYNALIAAGQTVRYETVPLQQNVFCGTPAEYEALLENAEVEARVRGACQMF